MGFFWGRIFKFYRGRISFPFCFSAFFVDFCFFWKLILKLFEIQPISCRWHYKKVFSKRLELHHKAQLCFRRNVDFLTFSRILRMFQDCFFKSAVQVWVKSTSAFDFCAVQTSLVQLHNFIFILKHFWTPFCFAFCLFLPIGMLIRPLNRPDRDGLWNTCSVCFPLKKKILWKMYRQLGEQ